MHASLHACKGILKEREGQKYAKEGLWFSAIRKGKAQRKYRKRRGVIDVASVGDSLSRILFIPWLTHRVCSFMERKKEFNSVDAPSSFSLYFWELPLSAHLALLLESLPSLRRRRRRRDLKRYAWVSKHAVPFFQVPFVKTCLFPKRNVLRLLKEIYFLYTFPRFFSLFLIHVLVTVRISNSDRWLWWWWGHTLVFPHVASCAQKKQMNNSGRGTEE